jgi:hypothetical protein
VKKLPVIHTNRKNSILYASEGLQDRRLSLQDRRLRLQDRRLRLQDRRLRLQDRRF